MLRYVCGVTCGVTCGATCGVTSAALCVCGAQCVLYVLRGVYVCVPSKTQTCLKHDRVFEGTQGDANKDDTTTHAIIHMSEHHTNETQKTHKHSTHTDMQNQEHRDDEDTQQNEENHDH